MTIHYIYQITNKINGKLYIGKSVNPISRFARHVKIAETFLESDNNFQAIHGAIKKYGKENFTLDTIEVCDENNIDERETHWIAFLNTQNKNFGYNLTAGGDGVKYMSEESKAKRRAKMLGRKLSEAHKQKIGQANMGRVILPESRQKISIANSGENNGMSGKTHSDEAKKKMSDFQSSRIRNSLSEEHKQKNRIAALKQDHSFRISIEIKHEIVRLYNSGNYTKRQLAEKFGMKYNTIVKIIRTHKYT